MQEHSGSRRTRSRLVNFFLNKTKYKVPSDLTILDAIEYAGFRLVRGVGCRQGMCGGCATIYRLTDDYRLYTALACQELVKDGMQVFILPYSPAKKTRYTFQNVKPSEKVLLAYYPELMKCLNCNTCTKACPQDLEVMDYVQAAIKGDFKKVAELSFECIECGLCAIRCPAEIVPYYVSRLARRIYARYILGPSKRVERRCKEIETGTFSEELETMATMDLQNLRQMYRQRDFV